MEEQQYSIPSMSTTDILSSLHPQHQYFQYYSSPIFNNTAQEDHDYDLLAALINNHVENKEEEEENSIPSMSTTDILSSLHPQHQYYTQHHQYFQYYSSPMFNNTAQEDHDYDLLAALINNHVENKEEEEEIVPWQAAADDVSSWEWPRFGGTLESIIDQAPCLAPLITHVPDHGVHDHGNKVEDEEEEEDDNDQAILLEDQEYCHMVPQVLAQMENTVVQSKHSTCNTEWMTLEEGDGHDQCYLNSHNSTPPPPPPSYHSQRKERKITEKRQMKKGKSSTTTISSSTNKRSKATILHNKSERKRRGKINDRLETLQKLLPNFNKTDKASMLDQVIEYVKKLQTQNDQIMNMRLRMFDNNNMPVVVHPMMMMPQYIPTMQAMQHHQQQYHQQQMSMMTQMGMGMSMNPADLVMMPTGSIVHPNMRQGNEHICSN